MEQVPPNDNSEWVIGSRYMVFKQDESRAHSVGGCTVQGDVLRDAALDPGEYERRPSWQLFARARLPVLPT